MLVDLLHPQLRRSILIEFNPHQVLAAGITRPRRGPVTVEFAAEFAPENNAALRQWLEAKTEYRRGWQNAICGLVPREGLLQRESVRADDLNQPLQLAKLLREQHSRRGGSTAPFADDASERWVIRAVAADDGAPLNPGGPQPALVVGLPHEEIRELEERLSHYRLVAARLEPALLALFGSLYGIMERRHQTGATVVIVLGNLATNLYILGKEGVHTPGAVTIGLTTIVQQVRREFALPHDEAARRLVWSPGDELRSRAARLVRGLGAALRPVVDSYEMTTGQPVSEIFCPYLPPALSWLAEPLARSIGHEPMRIDCSDWMQTAGLQPAPGVPAFGPHWLGALSLAAHLPERASLDGERVFGRGVSFQRSWHVDSRTPVERGTRGILQSRKGGGILAGALMVVAVALAAWQWQVARALRADVAGWEQQVAEHRALFTELTGALAALEADAQRLGRAHELMRAPFPPAEFLMEVGRTLPPRMRLERVEAAPGRVLLGGVLLEPAEEASRSLGDYLEFLRRTPAFRDRFAAITATSLQRARATEALAFEITLRLPAAPAP